MNVAEANVLAAAALADELAGAGVREVCMSPGSRSAPLVLAFDRHPSLRLRMMTDERCAAFFALGVARASGRPVALACTSGTAIANFAPAIVEAALSRVPLITLTADRPPELHEVGAPQTIRQSRFYGEHAVWSVDAPVPDGSVPLEHHFRVLACRLVAEAIDRRGPVHVNMPFREPLWDDSADALLARVYDRGEPRSPSPRVSHAVARANDEDLQRIAARLCAEPHGAIVVGPANGADLGDSAEIARALGWPLLADPLSGLRYGPYSQDVEDAYDLVLRNEEFRRQHRPGAVLRVGSLPVSKVLQGALAQWGADPHVLLAEGGDWPDPGRAATELLRGDAATNLRALVALVRRTGAHPDAEQWRLRWSRANASARAAVDGRANPLHEGAVARRVIEVLDDGDTLVVGNSMPIRDVDTFAPRCARRLRIYANRGANGIDGVMSTALGIASAGSGRTWLLVGDLSFLHDVGALQVADRHGIDLTVVLINNDGGGVFSFLHRPAEGFERLFATPHGLDVGRIAQAHGAAYVRADDADGLSAALEQKSHGLRVIEVPIDREGNAGIREHLVSVGAAAAGVRDEAAA